MEGSFDDEDRDALAAVANGPPHRKAHSLSTNIRHGGAGIPTGAATGGGGGSKRGGHTHHPHPHHRSNHSLDNDRLPLNIHPNTPTYDSSDDEEFYPYSTSTGSVGGVGAASLRYDHSVSLPTSGSSSVTDEDLQGAMPEFTASGAVGIFKAPTRAAVHPSRPPALELRPHPLRETQVGKFLRTIGCTDTQLWAGQENGVRFWKLSDVYDNGSGFGGRARRGDEDAAPFYESGNTSPTMCIVVDRGNRLIWTGHKDGKIRSWRMDQPASDDASPFKEGLSWQAHKGPVLCMIMSCYGNYKLKSPIC